MSEMQTPEMTAALNALIAEVWEFTVREDPLLATQCGDYRFNDRLPRVSEEATQQRADAWRAFRARLAQIEPAALTPEARLNHAILARELDDRLADVRFGLHRMPLAKLFGPHVSLSEIPESVPLRTVEDYEAYLARLRATPQYMADSIDVMRRGIAEGQVSARLALEGVAESLRAQGVRHPEESLFFSPFKSLPATFPEAEQARLREGARAAITEAVVPAFATLLQFLEQSYLPAARETVGVDALPDGAALYAHCVRKHTTLDVTPQQVHEIGLAEVARLREEMEAVMRQVGFTGDFHAFVSFMRSDPRFYAESPQALLKEVAYVLKRMDGALPELFSLLPRTPYGIREVPAYLAPHTTTAYYFPAAGDGSRAGFYYVNTYDLPSRPLYEVEALSLHEAVPGHHLQLALQMELDLPAFRRFGGCTAFIEGWALYAERLGLEVGFYEDPYSNFGRLTYEAWRASRLVVDTGLHALGWRRDRAIAFMLENTALSRLNVENEVDRYIAWPGQALAYKMGELKLRELRAAAERALGPRFDGRAFHRVVLQQGGIPLDTLEREVSAWLAGGAPTHPQP